MKLYFSVFQKLEIFFGFQKLKIMSSDKKIEKNEPDSSIKLVFVNIGSVRSLLEEIFETIYLNLKFRHFINGFL